MHYTHHNNSVLGNAAMADQSRTAEAVGDLTDSDTSITQRKQEVDKALMETVLVSLRGSLKELEEDNWLYEAARYTCH